MRLIHLFILTLIPFLSHAQLDTVLTDNVNYIEKNQSEKNNVHVIFFHKENKAVGFEGNYVNNEKDGPWIIYDNDGIELKQQSFKNGLPDGVWLVYNTDKYLERKEVFHEGNFVSGNCYNDKGEEIPYFRQPLMFVEKMPHPTYDLPKYIRKNLHYPASSKLAGVEGQVIVKFTVMEDGTISDVHIAKGLDNACNEEAIRLVKEMKPWTPGMQYGKTLPVYFAFPISFK